MVNAEHVEAHTLTETLIFELTKALAFPQTERARRVVRLIFGNAARAAAEVGMGLARHLEWESV